MICLPVCRTLVETVSQVSAKSVKLLEELDDREDSDAREAWWVEIRQEVRSHAKALGCNMVVGYQEKTVICEDVLIMSSFGTAAVCNLDFLSEVEGRGSAREGAPDCGVCHVPYTEASVPFPIKLARCGGCGRGRVADILLSTLEPPPELPITGQGGLIQARVLRLKKDLKGENDAREVSDALPFLEYEMHRQLVNKLKVKGMNAIFGVTVSLCLADRMLVGLMSGTAVCLPALPAPSLPRVLDSVMVGRDLQHITRLQDRLKEKVEANREYFGLVREGEVAGVEEGEVVEEEAVGEIDLSAGNKDTCVLEVDDIDDADIVDSLLDTLPPKVMAGQTTRTSKLITQNGFLRHHFFICSLLSCPAPYLLSNTGVQGIQVVSVHTPVGVDSSAPITACQAFSQVGPCVGHGQLETSTLKIIN